MTATVLVPLLLLTGAAVGAGACALAGLRGTRREIAALRAELALAGAGRIPAARSAADSDAIRTAVAAALADERERELADARAFWAAQEAREAADAPLLDGRTDVELPPFRPRPADLVGLEDGPDGADPARGSEEWLGEALRAAAGEAVTGRPAGRSHPSDPDFVPSPTVADPAGTTERMALLAEERIPLTDVRPGPLGTLDVYAFEDGTTLCLTPGDSRATGRLIESLRSGGSPVLLGGSAVGGAYALTFDLGGGSDEGGENVYVLADRVVASF
ncbi:hypothetical protein GCM10010406_35970 [Streptomyces thermolineatus]|uniref:Secreted protein n=1 Tax=Streptomyces thermolineatus TaxID=44033 RepID=A0ABN3MA44_9ACTN